MTAAKAQQHDKDHPCSPPQTLAPRLRAVRVGLRSDLEVSRHLFRGAVSYIIRDPITFQSQRLDPADYEILVAIDSRRGLSEIFDQLRRRGKMTTDDEEQFYQFVMHLHRLGFLRLPISDDKLLFRRYRAKRAARRKEKLFGFLFLRIPLWNPDAFLERTIGYVRPVFGKLFFALWLTLMACAAWVLVHQWQELGQPMQGLLAARNLPLIWITLIVLKIFHEFGHAYACKHLGGHVPEMGAYLIVFTPCAYMDATACWGFTSRRDRLIVCLAGMYVESVFAALAVFIWSSTGPSLLRDLAYNVIFLAGAVTVLFNINPLMRYDGYYIMSDLTEVPNLRQRSTRYVLNVLKRIFLGVPLEDRPATRRLGALLLCYGVSATVYRAALMLAIAAILASKMFVVGMMLAVFFVASGLVRIVRKLMKYLWHAEETAPMRRRAIALGLVTLIVVPALAVLLPVPTHVQARGILTTEHEAVIRAQTAGFLERSHVEDGDLVREGDLIALLGNDTCLERIAAMPTWSPIPPAPFRKWIGPGPTKPRWHKIGRDWPACRFTPISRGGLSTASRITTSGCSCPREPRSRRSRPVRGRCGPCSPKIRSQPLNRASATR